MRSLIETERDETFSVYLAPFCELTSQHIVFPFASRQVLG